MTGPRARGASSPSSSPPRRCSARARGLGALAALAALCAGLLWGQGAQAQTDTELWSATLTVGSTTTSTTLFGWNNITDDNSSFEDDSISGNSSFTHDALLHEVTFISNDNDSSGTLFLHVFAPSASPFRTAASLARITFHLGSGADAMSFNLGAATASHLDASSPEFTWTASGLTWAKGDSVPVRLTLAPADVSADATLSTLRINAIEGVDSTNVSYLFSPAFEPTTAAYSASVGDGVEQITVIGSVNDPNATVAVVDAQGIVLADAGSTVAGHQVSLATGTNTIGVKVTAQDGTTEMTYVLTVERQGPCPTVPDEGLWSACLTVGATSTDSAFGGLDSLLGYRDVEREFDDDSLSATDVTLPDSSEASITTLTNDSGSSGGTLRLAFGGATSWLDSQDNRDSLSFRAGDDTFPFADGSWSSLTNTWTGTGIQWKTGEPILVGLTQGLALEPVVGAAVAFTSDPNEDGREGDDATYAIGDAIEVTVTFSEAVTVDTTNGTPKFALKVGEETRKADFDSGSGSTGLVFKYEVVEGDEDGDGIEIEAGAIELNGGTIKAGTTDAVLSYAAEAADPEHKVDGVRPILLGAETSLDGESIIMTFNENLSSVDKNRFELAGVDPAATGLATPSYTDSVAVLALLPLFAFGHGDTVSFTVMEPGAVRDAAGNSNARLRDVSITNNVPAPPGAPTDLDAVAAGQTSINLSWTAPADDGDRLLTGYALDARTNSNDPWQRVGGTISAALTAFHYTGLQAGTRYYVRLVAFSDAGESAPSNEVDSTTDHPLPPSVMVPVGWSLIPDGLTGGSRFRLLVVEAKGLSCRSRDIGRYNRHFIHHIGNSGHTDIRAYAGGFRMLGSTARTAARDNTGTTGTGVAIYWLNGDKVADDNADLYDGSWSSQAARYPSGNAASSESFVKTGSNSDGTSRSGSTLGSSVCEIGQLTAGNELTRGGTTVPADTVFPFYVMSQEFEVARQATGVVSLAVTSDPNEDGRTGDDDTYAIGDTVEVTATFSFAVTVDTTSGTPQLELKVGDGTRQADYASGSGSTALVFSYTVAEGDEATGGVEIEENKLALNGGTIKTGTTDATLTHGAEAADSEHKVDGVRPTFVSAETSEDGTKILATFSENIASVAKDLFAWVGVETSVITSASRMDEVVTFGVLPQFAIEHGDTVSIEQIGSSAVRDAAGNGNAQVTDLLITNTVPAPAVPIAGVAITSTAVADGNYATGEAIAVTVTFGEAVTVDASGGTPRLRIDLGDGANSGRHAVYASGSGSEALVFRYTVAAGDESGTAGIALRGADVVELDLDLNGGTIQGAGGTDAELSHPWLSPDPDHRVNWARPMLVENGAATSSDGASIVLTFDENLSGAGTTARYTVKVDGSGVALSGNPTFSDRTVTLTVATPVTAGQTVTVSYEDATANDDNVAIEDLRRNDADSFTTGEDGVPAVTNTVPDADAVRVVSIELTSDPGGDDTYAIGDELIFEVKFSDVVICASGGTNRVLFDLGASRKEAEKFTGSGDTFGYRYTVEEGDLDTDGIAIPAGPEALPDSYSPDDCTADGGLSDTLFDATGIAAQGPLAEDKVDGVRPTLVSAETSIDGLRIALAYSEPLSASTTPARALEVAVDSGTAPDVTGVSASGETVTLSLDAALTDEQDVTVSYADPSTGDDANAIQDEAGNDAASFTREDVTNEVTGEPAITLSVTSPPSVLGLVLREDFADGETIKLRAETEGDVAPTKDFTVGLRVVDGTAVEGQDFEPLPSFTFEASQFTLESGRHVLEVEGTFRPVDDDVVEELEFIEVGVDAGTLPKHVTEPDNFEIQILNDDALTVRIAGDAQGEEGNAIVVTLATDVHATYDFTLEITYADAAGGAVRDDDYTATTAVTFPALKTETTFRIATLEDRKVEDDETFTIGVSYPAGGIAILADGGTATMTIADDDHAPEVLTETMRVLTGRTEVSGRLRGRDADGDRLIWRITGGADDHLFTVTEDGQLSLDMPRTLAAPGDANGDEVYELVVVASDGVNDSLPAAIRVSLLDAAPPSPPQGLVVMAANENEVMFRWDPPADDGGAPVLRYAYRYGDRSGGWRSHWTYVGSVPEGEPPRRSWALSVNADEEPEVCVQVMAVNLANWLAVPELRSLEGNPTQETCVEPFGPAEGAPAAPESLSVTSVRADRAELAWSAPDGTGDSLLWGYRVEVSTDGGGSWSVVEENTGTPALRWSDDGVASLAERLYRVRAVNTAYGAGNPSPAARLAPMALERLDTRPEQHFENPGDARASSHSVTAVVELTNPAPGREVHVRLLDEDGGPAQTAGGETLAPRAVEAAGTSVAATFEDLPAQTKFTVTADVRAGFGSPEERWKLAITLPDIRQGGGGPGRGVEVDANGDGAADAEPELTLAMGGRATFRVRPGACAGAKELVLQGPSIVDGPRHFGPVAVDASPDGYRWTCAGGGDAGEWQAIELSGPKNVDAMLAAPFDATLRHDVYTQKPGHGSWQQLLSWGRLVKLRLTATQALAAVGRPQVAMNERSRPVVHWDAVAGAGAYQVQWRWGSEAYGRVHMENGEMSSREQRVTETSHTVPVGAPSEETLAQGLTVRVRAFDGDALTVGPWRVAVLAATPGRPTGLTAEAESATAIRLAWRAPADHGARILGYGIEVSEDGREWQALVGFTASAATAHVHRDLQPGSQRFYRVRARNRAGAGGWSHLAGASTPTAAQANAGDALTVRTDGLPERGEGSEPFAFRLVFSEAVTVTEAAFRAHALAVTGGTVSAASRVADEPGAWVVTVAPDSGADVTVALRGGRPCDEAGAICTADGRRLGHGLLMAVPGRAALHGAPVLAGFVLVDAASGTDLGPVADGATVRLKDPAGGSYDLRVETAAEAGVGSVRLALAGPGEDDAAARTDDAAPWLLRGAADGTGAGAALPAGSYALTATAYAEPGGGGGELGSLSVRFTVARSVLTGFVLVDATAHADAGALADGARLTGIDPAKVYGFRAEVAAQSGVESVTFALSGSALEKDEEQTESWAPYSLYGDSGGNEHGAALPLGSYTLAATAWSEDGGKGDALETLSVAFTVGEAEPETPAEPLTAAFEEVPESHAGSGTVTFRVAFSEPVTLGEDAFAAHGLIVGNATVSAAARIEGAPGVWEVTIAPASRTAVTVTLAADRACAEEGALCTADGRALGSAPEASIAGPPAAPVLAGFELVDLGAGGQRTALGSGATVTLSDASGGSYGIVAAIAEGQTVGSVAFVLDEPGEDPDVTRTESIAPYSLHGDDLINPNGAPLPAGRYALSATAWSGRGATGTVLGTLSVSFTVRAADTATVAETALTALYVGMPPEHDGSTAFTFRVRFSEDVKVGFAALRDSVFAVHGAEVTGARRVDGRQDLREITVKPTGRYEVRIDLDGNVACDQARAICTAGGKMLSNALTATVPGPPALSVADATVTEGAGATLDFLVTLDRAASGPVTVEYATVDSGATAGEDYEAASGTLSFQPGETLKTVSVTVLDDAVDDGGEQVKFVLFNATGAWIADSEAFGTIENADPMPSAWLVRFGRTVGSQVVDAVTARFEAPGASHVTLGGQRLSLDGEAGDAEGADRLSAHDEQAARETLTALADRFADPADPADGARDRGQAGVRSVDGWMRDGWMRDGAGADARTMTGRELLLGSSFHLAAGGEDGAAAVAAWGRVATGGFDAEVDEVRLDGAVTTAMLGADVAHKRWLAGAAIALSEGTGGYALTSEAESAFDKGEVESRLTSVFPYARLALNERVSAWGLVGYGTGTLTLTEENGDTAKRYTTDIGLRMGAVGARGTLVAPAEAGGFELALRTDAMLLRTTSDATEGMAASQSDASRLRLILDGSRSFEAGGGTLTPRLEVGLRHDGGDAETGTGIELGAGLSYQANGIAVEGAVRGLIAHEDEGYREWGASGSVRIDPGASGRGLSLTLRPTWGAASSGTERLWGLRDASGLASDGEFEPERRLDAELGYGLSVLDGRGVATPYAGWSQAGERETLRLGQRLRLGQGTEWRLEGELGEDARIWRAGYGYSLGSGLTFTTEASRREAANDDAPEHALVLRASMRW